MLLHPYRPLNASYPPGELPPPEVIDELAGQVVRFAHIVEGDERSTEDDAGIKSGSWRRSREVTRKKIFEVALAESKFGHELDRKTQKDSTSGSGGSRPGLRRMDSMDFLDEREDEDGDVGRTMRLSTSLQNSAKQEPVVVLPKISRTGSGQLRTRSNVVTLIYRLWTGHHHRYSRFTGTSQTSTWITRARSRPPTFSLTTRTELYSGRSRRRG